MAQHLSSANPPNEHRTALIADLCATYVAALRAGCQGTGQPQKPFQACMQSPDGALMLAGYDDGTVQVFDAAMRQPLGEPMRHEGAVTAISFTHDGKELLTTGVDRALKRWQAPHQFPQTPDAVQAWIERRTAWSVDPNNKSLRLLKREEWLKLADPEDAHASSIP